MRGVLCHVWIPGVETVLHRAMERRPVDGSFRHGLGRESFRRNAVLQFHFFLSAARHVFLERRQAHFGVHERPRDLFAHRIQHDVEKIEGLAAVFVQGVALAVAAQMDALTQLVQREQMVLPRLIQNAEKGGFFGARHVVEAHHGRLGGHFLFRRFLKPFLDFDFGDAFFLAPREHGRIQRQNLAHALVQAFHIPLFGIGVRRNGPRNHRVNDVMAQVADAIRDAARRHDVAALFVDDLALVVEHIVELEQVLADVEVARLDLLLRLFQRPVDPRQGSSPSRKPSLARTPSMRSEPKMRIKSSSSDK